MNPYSDTCGTASLFSGLCAPVAGERENQTAFPYRTGDGFSPPALSGT
jgi:hypothetical protein